MAHLRVAFFLKGRNSLKNSLERNIIQAMKWKFIISHLSWVEGDEENNYKPSSVSWGEPENRFKPTNSQCGEAENNIEPLEVQWG